MNDPRDQRARDSRVVRDSRVDTLIRTLIANARAEEQAERNNYLEIERWAHRNLKTVSDSFVTQTSFDTHTEAPGHETENVYVQQSNPAMTVNGIWVELNADNTVKTFWINTP